MSLLLLLQNSVPVASDGDSDLIALFGQTSAVETVSFRIVIGEISETTSLDNVFIWEQDAWEVGKTWGE